MTTPELEQPQATRMTARVKWFNTEKRFGFIAPDDGSADAFVHASVIERAGLDRLPEGAVVEIMLATTAKGAQVIEILSLDPSVPLPSEPKPEGLPALAGDVKWFAPEKGFGFVAADDGGKDIFVHKSVLRRCGFVELTEGQRVEVVFEPTHKGREALWIGRL